MSICVYLRYTFLSPHRHREKCDSSVAPHCQRKEDIVVPLPNSYSLSFLAKFYLQIVLPTQKMTPNVLHEM